MAALLDEITVLEHTHIFPAPNATIGNKSFPLSCLDIPYVLPGYPTHSLFFYNLPHSKSHLIQTTIPNIKHSLSTTLQYFSPLAGNLIIYPFRDSSSIPTKPEIRYLEGDSVSFTVAESKGDFIYLTRSHARKAHKFYPLVPELGGITRDSGNIEVPLLAVQVTIFPNHGISIGTTNHHAAGDGLAFLNFLRAWGSITKFGNDKPFLASGSLPLFDKSFIKDPNGMDAMIWSHVAKAQSQKYYPPLNDSGENDNVRASFIITNDQINQVKKFILAHRPTIARVSSMVIVCAHVWTCMAKVREVIGEQKGLDEREQFVCAADCRARMDTPVPKTYFANCVVPFETNTKRNQLLGEEGFFNAVELIGDSILAGVQRTESIDACSGIWMEAFKIFYITSSLISVAGSPMFDSYYAADFGWGNPKKVELFGSSNSKVVWLIASRDSKKDIEISLSLTKIQMDLFETIFTKELKIIRSNPLILSKI